jgi:hypothetical protein
MLVAQSKGLIASNCLYGDPRDFVLVSYRILWVDSIEIIDQFLWPKAKRDAKEMKMFAIDSLSDILGSKTISKYDTQHVHGKYFCNSAAFASYVAYIINREIDIDDHLNSLSVSSLVKDGCFGTNGSGYGEHLIEISLKFGDFTDKF